MYLRTTIGKTKNGPVRYIQLAHNVRHPQTGVPTAQVLFNFGREDQLDRAALQRLVTSIRRFLDGEPGDQLPAGLAASNLEMLRSRSMGGPWTLDQLWQKLGIAQAILRVLGSRHDAAQIERALFAMVANRALAPASKLSVSDWLCGPVFVPGCEQAPLPPAGAEREAERKRRVNRLYQAMDALASVEQKLQEQVFWAISEGDLLKIEVDLLYFDTTSIYWETDPEDDDAEEDGEDGEGGGAGRDLRQLGHSKDHRPDLPQIVIGLAVTRQGIPVRCWVWSGNTTDVSVIAQVKRDLIGWKLGRVISVLDRGFVSEDNLKTLQLGAGHYIAGEKLRSGKADVEAALSRAGRYTQVRDNLHVKEVVIGDGEARRRFVLVKNPAQAERDRRERERTLARLQLRLQEIGHLDRGEHTKAVCELCAHPVYGRFLRSDAKGQLKIDQAKVRAEQRLDGKYLLRTSDDTLTPEDVALGYKQLSEIESAFRTLKTVLELRPVYHRTRGRIRAHVVLCWLALLLVRVIEIKTGRRWPGVRRDLESMHLVEFTGPDGGYSQRTAMTVDQRRILAATGVSEPPKLFGVTPRPAATA
jgi:transposase